MYSCDLDQLCSRPVHFILELQKEILLLSLFFVMPGPNTLPSAANSCKHPFRICTPRNISVPQGFVPAMNALAWYYEQFERDYEQAVQLWEKADLLESPDAALNLGVMYFQGLYPGKAADQVSSATPSTRTRAQRSWMSKLRGNISLSFPQYMAYKYYLKSAERGHVRGALLLADIWTTGLPGQVNRRPSDAVLLATYPFIHITYHTYDVCLRQDEVLVFPPTACRWVKWAAESNGYLGRVLRKALNSYLKSDM